MYYVFAMDCKRRRQTDRRQYDANSRSYCMAVRAAKIRSTKSTQAIHVTAVVGAGFEVRPRTCARGYSLQSPPGGQRSSDQRPLGRSGSVRPISVRHTTVLLSLSDVT